MPKAEAESILVKGFSVYYFYFVSSTGSFWQLQEICRSIETIKTGKKMRHHVRRSITQDLLIMRPWLLPSLPVMPSNKHSKSFLFPTLHLHYVRPKMAPSRIFLSQLLGFWGRRTIFQRVAGSTISYPPISERLENRDGPAVYFA